MSRKVAILAGFSFALACGATASLAGTVVGRNAANSGWIWFVALFSAATASFLVGAAVPLERVGAKSIVGRATKLAMAVAVSELALGFLWLLLVILSIQPYGN